MKREQDETTNEILIAGLTPYFLEKPLFWFRENLTKIKLSAKTQSWWRNRTLFLKKDQKIALSSFLRRLDELGYEKVQKVSDPLHNNFSSRNLRILSETRSNDEAVSAKQIQRGGATKSQPKFSNCSRKGYYAKGLMPGEFSRLGGNRKIGSKKKAELLKNLLPGDYVVHVDHGIGIYRGITVQDGTNYCVIEYAPPREGKEPDRLYVPENQLGKIDRYVGFTQPKIHRLGGELWLKMKKRIKEDVEKFARELLETYAKREITRRTPYPPDDQIQKEFEQSFEHIETEDQLQAIREIKNDMESERPMDRLICGDVGFGKTEVALRAAFKAAWSGRQVTVLCPTTILADQHFQTFQERLKNFPLRLGVLSRFESKKKQRETIAKMAEGKIDVVIGTHRLLSKDVVFKNLGLLIIDEEQKFGVRQKEKLKKFRNEIDILSLSATPIPRTLQFSLFGLRSLSLISTPPPGRRQIETKILPYSKETIKKAIEEELNRKGQIYFLHNRVETIGKAARNLKQLVPKAKIAVAHGKMSEEELRQAMNDFRQNKFNVLAATTIIENGLDLPQVNTLIVTNCARLGLAQSYQIRGRIGRSHKKAYAYFFYGEQKLEGKALMRLEALKRAESLGSGYQLAQADLEIRGAGNILGKQQSGNINQIGLNLYCHILNEAVEQIKQISENIK
ncbi:MAG: Transcription-repair coupling factor [Candidatus Azambacteria bacterium GW2011_GWA2_45_90]|uniref:Transcription-repair coupling factor n=1 Tax=Candidatus Azambacteria bacterium GW2011_GWA2_45_90 TaxID=1618614 RepID=A0A0G1NEQ9_9BACT|nr:MAG: Transcription-repair coupling factor [Candidatus Azambacteria bacterium GW2011_GWA2_45_90]